MEHNPADKHGLEKLKTGFPYDAGVEWLPDWRSQKTSGGAACPILWREESGSGVGIACVQYGINLRANLAAATRDGALDDSSKAVGATLAVLATLVCPAH
eukprot:SAG31_NODE_6016_length_2213_cov_5.098392_1_plen_100_part_00